MIHLSRRAAAVVTAGALMAFQALAIVGAGPASAVAACSFNLASKTVSVTAGAAGDSMALTVVDATGEIQLNGGAGSCGLADTTNTTTIVVAGSTGDEDLIIDSNSDGEFPSTISWQIAMGGGTADYLEFDFADGAGSTLTLGNTSFTLNGASGVTGGVEDLAVYGGDGDDTIDGSALTAAVSFEAYGDQLGVTPGGEDTITGGAGDDFLSGEDGDDTISGGAGDDTIFGSWFTVPVLDDDTITGGAGDDDIDADQGDDVINEEAADSGADDIYGDTGFDTVDYSARTTSIAVNADSGLFDSGADVDGDGDASETGDEGDRLDNIEGFMTGSGADNLNGAAADEVFTPGAGDDTVDGNGGDDTLDFSGSATAVTVDAAGGTADGEGADTFTDGVDMFVGSDLDDTFISDGDAWTFSGGDGVDTVDYSAETTGVEADLSGVAVTSDDTFPDNDVENAMGGSGDDDFTGNSLRNSLWGGEGDDTLDGVGGNDTFYGGAGSDDMTGGTGVDLVSFADSTAGVDVDLSLEVASSADGDDTVATMEGVVGSAFADTILGSGATNLIKAGKGDDFVRAGTGDDTVAGAGGDDTLVGGGGDDSLFGRAGDDALFGGGGTDFGNGGKGKDVCKGVEIKKSC